MLKKLTHGFIIFLLTLTVLTGCAPAMDALPPAEQAAIEQEAWQLAGEIAEAVLAENRQEAALTVDEDGLYGTKDEVALYLNTYGHLPDNYITKKEAEKLGWESREGNLWEVAPGMSIGGDYFGNYEGALPEKEGREYRECDINFDGSYRGAERIIYSDDGLIYYTGDHYETFELLYGEE